MPKKDQNAQDIKNHQENDKIERKENSTTNQQTPIRMKDEVFKIINTSYSDNESQGIKQFQISKILLKIKNQAIDPNWEDTEEFKKNHENDGFFDDVQPTVSKHLKTLCSEKKILKLNDGLYIPYNLTDARKILKEELIESLSFNRERIYIFSTSSTIIKKKNNNEDAEDTNEIINEENPDNNKISKSIDSNEEIESGTNTENNAKDNNPKEDNNNDIKYSNCTILVDVRYDYIEKAKQLFKQYIGVKNCYDIIEFQGRLMILLEGTQEEVSKLRNDIRSIVKKSYKKEMEHKKR